MMIWQRRLAQPARSRFRGASFAVGCLAGPGVVAAMPLDVPLVSLPLQFDAVVVSAPAICVRRPDEATRIAAL